jgi:hypothetical protein
MRSSASTRDQFGDATNMVRPPTGCHGGQYDDDDPALLAFGPSLTLGKPPGRPRCLRETNSRDSVARIDSRVRRRIWLRHRESRSSIRPVLPRLGDCVDAVDTIELEPLHRAAASQKAARAGFQRRAVSHRALGAVRRNLTIEQDLIVELSETIGRMSPNNTRHASPRKRTKAGFLLPVGWWA